MDVANIWKIVSFSAPAILFTGIILCAIVFRRLNGIYKLIYCYLIIALATEMISRYFGFVSSVKSNLFLIPVYALIEMLLFSALYLKHMLNVKMRYYRITIAVASILIVGEIVFTLSNYSARSFLSYSKALDNIVIIVLAVRFIFELFKGEKAVSKDKIVLNYIVIAYFIINLIVFLPLNFLITESVKLVTLFWLVNLLSMLTYYVLLFNLIWKNGRIR